MTEWSKEKERKILWKYRFTLSLRILRIAAALWFLWMIYMVIANIIMDAQNKSEKHTFYSQLALAWKNPTISATFGAPESAELDSFLTETITYPVQRTIGKGEKAAGEMVIKKKLWTSLSERKLIKQEPSQSDFYFYLPKGDQVDKVNNVQVWSTLEKVHEGTVADMALSTLDYQSPEELFDILAPFDLNVIWMPLDTGEFKSFNPGYAGDGNWNFVDAFGLTAGLTFDEKYRSQSKAQMVPQNVKENEKIMLNHMKQLLDKESESYYESFLGLDHLEERHRYLKDNGFLVYGAVVTGPVKELLKLRQLESIHAVQLGDMDYWNWD